MTDGIEQAFKAKLRSLAKEKKIDTASLGKR